MLVCTTSCDAGVQFDLACDGCGEVLSAGPVRRRSAEELLACAAQLGWILTPATHCASCAARPVRTTGLSAGTGNGR